jgi:hypothetical protein
MKPKAWLAALVLGLAAFSLGATPCAPSATSLCLAAGRFEVSVAWKDFQGKTGVGQAVPLSADTGYFWFFTSNNIELVVKVLDARGINHKFWVFFGALSSVEYDLTVRDSVSNLTKHYHNPSGQFASVGDTEAFDESAGVVLVPEEAVTVEGTAAPPDSIAVIQKFIDSSTATSAFTPCPGPSNRLYLANCRFAVEVAWTASPTNLGSGQGVQLTGDTGYFWFFNESNVELMVKVLDARPISGRFWVFFGALSNVEYTITVIDTVSGALRTYHNPATTFASVGDTGAFRGGYGISVQTDDSLAVSGTITAAAGGSLSATAADGTVFTLEVPPDAIFQDQDIILRPVRTSAGVPFAGGLAAGVDIQPSGLVLLTGGQLTIHSPAPISRSEETPVGWNGSGEDFFLVPPDPVAGDLTLLVSHFGGYGVARGTDAERETQLGREPVEDLDLLGHRTSPLLRSGRTAAAGITSVALKAALDWQGDVKAAYDNYFGTLWVWMLGSDGEPAEVVRLITRVQDWRTHVLKYLGQVDEVWPGRDEAIFSQYERLVKLALGKIHERCSHDPQEITALPPLAHFVGTLGLNAKLDVDEAMRCLTFKLVFNSQVHGFSHLGAYGDLDIKDQVQATLTLRTPSYVSRTEGEGTIDHTEISITGIPRESGCTYMRTSGPDTFKAAIQWSNLYNNSGGLVRIEWLYYNPGRPPSNVTLKCPGSDPIPLYLSWWAEFFVLNKFSGAPEYPFRKGDWGVYGGQDPWAKANQLHNSVDILEVTNFTLTHTPE